MASTHAIPQIESNGYELVSVPQFLERASAKHIERYRRDCIGQGRFIIWDPNDDPDGFMVCAMTVAELNSEFLDHFGESAAA